jgi:ammonium transporter, Amt family
MAASTTGADPMASAARPLAPPLPARHTGSRALPLSIGILLAVALAIGLAARAVAGTSAGAFDARNVSAGDTAWVLTATALVMLMTPAVGFFYGGMVSSKNVVSVIKQSFLILSLVSLQWVLVGYSLVFGQDVGGVIGGVTFFGLRQVG